MNCKKNCYHYTTCKTLMPESMLKYSYMSNTCEQFKDKSKLIELPCNIGDKVWVIQKAYTKCSSMDVKYDDVSCAGCENECDSQLTQEIKEVLVDGFEINSLGFKIHLHNDWKIYLPNEELFFTKEDAEKRLNELCK